MWASQIALIQPVHGQGYILIFLDWMHLLFTLVHFLFWQPGRVVGQYTTETVFEAMEENPVSSIQRVAGVLSISQSFAVRPI